MRRVQALFGQKLFEASLKLVEGGFWLGRACAQKYFMAKKPRRFAMLRLTSTVLLVVLLIIGVTGFVWLGCGRPTQPTPLLLTEGDAVKWLKQNAPTVSWESLQVGNIRFFGTRDGFPVGLSTSNVTNLKVGWPAGIVFSKDPDLTPLDGGIHIKTENDPRCSRSFGSRSNNEIQMCTNVSVAWTSYELLIYPDISTWFE